MKKLKVLVFEYITGGGLSKSDLPESLANEGLLMLRALLDNLLEIDMVEPLVMVDYRMIQSLAKHPVSISILYSEDDYEQKLTELLQTCDAVWPIAPETGGVLQKLCEQIQHSTKLLLTSPADVVAIAADKWLTYQQLSQHSITTVPTQQLAEFKFTSGEWIIKPVDGVGCEDSYLLTYWQDFEAIYDKIDLQHYIIQPHLHGRKTSLSCLFKQGRGWLICANLQHFDIINQQYNLTEITINFTTDTIKYQSLIEGIAKAMPDLWGYVGIDLIEIVDQILVLEINPRLTTSFAGIHVACGINCANAVLNLLTGEPNLVPTHSQAINIKVTEQEQHAN